MVFAFRGSSIFPPLSIFQLLFSFSCLNHQRLQRTSRHRHHPHVKWQLSNWDTIFFFTFLLSLLSRGLGIDLPFTSQSTSLLARLFKQQNVCITIDNVCHVSIDFALGWRFDNHLYPTVNTMKPPIFDHINHFIITLLAAGFSSLPTLFDKFSTPPLKPMHCLKKTPSIVYKNGKYTNWFN